MSRSRFKNPAGGITKAETNKSWKVMAHRAARRATHQILRATEDGDATPHPKAHGDPWTMPKDGKTWYGSCWPELLRK